MKDFLKESAKYAVGPVLAFGLFFAALKFSPPASLTPAVPSLPTVNTPATPPPKITRAFVTRNDEAIAPPLEADIIQVLDTAENGVYHYVGYPETGKLVRKRITIESADAPVVVTPTTPATPDKPVTPTVPEPVSPGTQVVYVYEKDDTAVQPFVYSALESLSGKLALAATFEKDTRNGKGEVPLPYRVPLEAALKAGLPAVVASNGPTVLKVVKDPKNEAEFLSVAP